MLKFKKDSAISSAAIAVFLVLIGCVIGMFYLYGQRGMMGELNQGMAQQTTHYISTLQ